MKIFRILGAVAMCSWSLQASAVVEGVEAEATGSDAVAVSWNADEDAAYYELYQDSVRIETGLTTTSVVVSGLEPDTYYQYFVTACSAGGVCSAASPQSSVTTDTETSDNPDICEPATDGSAPTVEISQAQDGKALLSWCAVMGAEGYNLFLNNEYQTTFNASTYSATVAYDGTQQYQIAWYADGNYPPKSAVAGDPLDPVDPGDDPQTDAELIASLDQPSYANTNDVEIYFTRHAEKMTQLAEQDDGSFMEVCGESKCAEVLNAKGELRAELLARLFSDAGITQRLDHAFSSHKIRTRQTIELIAAEAGLSGHSDKNEGDGIQEYPVFNEDGTDFATELSPESTTPSEAPVIAALQNLPAGSVALVAGHSGTLYDIMAGLGLDDVCLSATVDSCNQDRYPIDDSVKVRNFGDIWKVTLEDGVANFVYRVNVQPVELALEELVQ